ncbi:LOW QUALITY PROTEIN: SH3 domain-binding protein 5-like [Harpia harpyja]|uniref:LOW QUALITY PROTEIN: SH3 domain-binding protein 5-like n=1 Tax=Harpia harpyja TaxID=202280 RepID=UPI0022B16F5C|nr:LOW QUALITY PROTEIN: SH3 domain-binding protein 5-like [Harpia harpyja]
MGDAEERLVWGTNGGDGRQTPPGQLGVSPGGDEDEAGTAVSGGACEGEEPRTPPKVVGEEEEEEEELDPRIQEELEHLNQANEEINRVELQLDVSFSPSP